MKNLIRELQRREVFKTLGLYIGISWIIIEAANMLLPAFDAPDWLFRSIVIVAITGFPIVAVLAWIYDITSKRISTEASSPHTPLLSGRKMDFIVIGVLSVALVLSLYANFSQNPEDNVKAVPISVIIADFDNQTGDDIFTGILERGLEIGIESAPNVMSLTRRDAITVARQLQPDTEGLTEAAARLVATREGIELVLTGSIAPSGQGYLLTVSGKDTASGEVIFNESKQASTRDNVLTALGLLSLSVRERLGDTTLESNPLAIPSDTFTAASLEAASAYITAQRMSFTGRHEEAISLYQKAIELDPNFGRAYSGWAISEFNLGDQEESNRLFNRAISLMGTLTERERLRIMGNYYLAVNRNYEQAVSTYSELIRKFPADSGARNNLAVTSFLMLDFDAALEQGRQVLDMFPNSELYKSNYALYAMYDSRFDEAAAAAHEIVEEDPNYGTAFLPLAIASLANDDLVGAREAYAGMRQATRGQLRESYAVLGLADTAIYAGEFDSAITLLNEGVAVETGFAAALKYIALAEIHLATGNDQAAVEAGRQALSLSQWYSIRVSAAMIFIEADQPAEAMPIRESLTGQISDHERAYGLMVEGALQRYEGDYINAIQTIRFARETADLWRINLELGRTYLEGGYAVEAFDVISSLRERIGEASAIYLDDIPTYRFVAQWLYWLGRVQDSAGMLDDAADTYRRFLSLRPQGGLLAEDVRQRIE